MAKIKLMALSTTLLLAAAGLGCRPSQSLEGQAKDARMTTEIKSKLVSQVNASTLTAVDVNVTNGVVTLAGPVHSVEESRKVESVARSVEGVTEVKNALQVISETVVTAVPAGSSPIPPVTTPRS